MRKDNVAMNRINEFGKRFLAYLVFCLAICFGMWFIGVAWEKLKEWWFWMPAKLGSNALEWLQDHPPLFALAICVTLALIGTIGSYIFRDK